MKNNNIGKICLGLSIGAWFSVILGFAFIGIILAIIGLILSLINIKKKDILIYISTVISALFIVFLMFIFFISLSTVTDIQNNAKKDGIKYEALMLVKAIELCIDHKKDVSSCNEDNLYDYYYDNGKNSYEYEFANTDIENYTFKKFDFESYGYKIKFNDITVSELKTKINNY